MKRCCLYCRAVLYFNFYDVAALIKQLQMNVRPSISCSSNPPLQNGYERWYCFVGILAANILLNDCRVYVYVTAWVGGLDGWLVDWHFYLFICLFYMLNSLSCSRISVFVSITLSVHVYPSRLYTSVLVCLFICSFCLIIRSLHTTVARMFRWYLFVIVLEVYNTSPYTHTHTHKFLYTYNRYRLSYCCAAFRLPHLKL